MKIKITATSSYYSYSKSKIIEVISIDEAINILQSDKELVKYIIDKTTSNLYHEFNLNKPDQFVINTIKHCDYDIEIEIYDTFRE